MRWVVERSGDLPAEKKFTRNDRDGIGHLVEESGNIAGVEALPLEIVGVCGSWRVTTVNERVELLQEAVVWMNVWPSWVQGRTRLK